MKVDIHHAYGNKFVLTTPNGRDEIVELPADIRNELAEAAKNQNDEQKWYACSICERDDFKSKKAVNIHESMVHKDSK